MRLDYSPRLRGVLPATRSLVSYTVFTGVQIGDQQSRRSNL